MYPSHERIPASTADELVGPARRHEPVCWYSLPKLAGHGPLPQGRTPVWYDLYGSLARQGESQRKDPAR